VRSSLTLIHLTVIKSAILRVYRQFILQVFQNHAIHSLSFPTQPEPLHSHPVPSSQQSSHPTISPAPVSVPPVVPYPPPIFSYPVTRHTNIEPTCYLLSPESVVNRVGGRWYVCEDVMMCSEVDEEEDVSTNTYELATIQTSSNRSKVPSWEIGERVYQR